MGLQIFPPPDLQCCWKKRKRRVGIICFEFFFLLLLLRAYTQTVYWPYFCRFLPSLLLFGHCNLGVLNRDWFWVFLLLVDGKVGITMSNQEICSCSIFNGSGMQMFLHFGRNVTVVAYANLTMHSQRYFTCTFISPTNASKVARTKKKLFRILPNSPKVWAVRLCPNVSHRRDGREPTAILDNT